MIASGSHNLDHPKVWVKASLLVKQFVGFCLRDGQSSHAPPTRHAVQLGLGKGRDLSAIKPFDEDHAAFSMTFVDHSVDKTSGFGLAADGGDLDITPKSHRSF